MRLTLGNKEFELKLLTLNDWIRAEDLGLDMERLRTKEKIKLKDIRTLVYVSLSKCDNSITPEWVGENISLDNMETFNQIVNFIKPVQSTVTENT